MRSLSGLSASLQALNETAAASLEGLVAQRDLASGTGFMLI